MPDVRGLAAAYGVRVEVAPLGDWSPAMLIAEYDPAGPTIRVNAAALPHGDSCVVRDAIDRAIAHELYHHREASGEVAPIRDRRAREAAAGAYADAMTQKE